MSSRSARVERRARERARQRKVLRNVLGSPGQGTGACLVPGCSAPGPVVAVGEVHLTLCAGHKRDFDAAWALSARPRLPAA